MNRLTIGAAIELQAYTDPSLSAPVHWNEANVAGQNGVLQLVANHAFAVNVSFKRLKRKEKHKKTDSTHFYIWSIKHATTALDNAFMALQLHQLDTDVITLLLHCYCSSGTLICDSSQETRCTA